MCIQCYWTCFWVDLHERFDSNHLNSSDRRIYLNFVIHSNILCIFISFLEFLFLYFRFA